MQRSHDNHFFYFRKTNRREIFDIWKVFPGFSWWREEARLPLGGEKWRHYLGVVCEMVQTRERKRRRKRTIREKVEEGEVWGRKAERARGKNRRRRMIKKRRRRTGTRTRRGKRRKRMIRKRRRRNGMAWPLSSRRLPAPPRHCPLKSSKASVIRVCGSADSRHRHEVDSWLDKALKTWRGAIREPSRRGEENWLWLSLKRDQKHEYAWIL